jgi:hypothetical protein
MGISEKLINIEPCEHYKWGAIKEHKLVRPLPPQKSSKSTGTKNFVYSDPSN